MTPVERDALARRHLALVRRTARRVARVISAADLDDLIGDGSVGLLRAIDTFDASRGVTFEAYARRVVLGAMLNGMRRTDPVSERVRRTLRAAERTRYARAAESGALPSYAELERDAPALRRARIDAFRRSVLSLDAPLTSDAAVLGDLRSEPAAVLERRDERREIAEAIALLPPREQRILALHYGRDLPLGAIGRELSVSAQRVSQLHLRAITALRRTLPAEADYR